MLVGLKVAHGTALAVTHDRIGRRCQEPDRASRTFPQEPDRASRGHAMAAAASSAGERERRGGSTEEGGGGGRHSVGAQIHTCLHVVLEARIHEVVGVGEVVGDDARSERRSPAQPLI
jgi:hypothetical protein